MLCSRAQCAVTFKGFVTRCSCASVPLLFWKCCQRRPGVLRYHTFPPKRIQRQANTLIQTGENRWKTRPGTPCRGSFFHSATSWSKNVLPAPVNPSDVISTSCSLPSVDVHLFQCYLLLEDNSRLCCSCCCCPTSPPGLLCWCSSHLRCCLCRTLLPSALGSVSTPACILSCPSSPPFILIHLHQTGSFHSFLPHLSSPPSCSGPADS